MESLFSLQIKFRQTMIYWLALSVIIFSILLWRDSVYHKKPDIERLPVAPSLSSLPFFMASDQAFSYRIILFWLQQFDVQSGQYVSYKNLNYENLEHWLEVLSKLEPHSQYPILLATRIYTRVADESKKRQMLEFVYQQFLLNPAKNWRWLSEAVVVAKYGLKDLNLAYRFASALHDSSVMIIPQWARDTKKYVIQKIPEIELVRLLIGGMMVDHMISDQNELEFLDNYLINLGKAQ